jgi:predicted RNase H-like HicB family nuclease
MRFDHYTYRVTWSSEDDEHIGLCTEFPSLSWLAPNPEAALAGIRKVVAEAAANMQAEGEPIPEPLAEKITAASSVCVFHPKYTVPWQ